MITATKPTVDDLAREWNVSPASVQAIRAERNGEAWLFSERDGKGVVIGTARRLNLGKKLMLKGSKRGLTMAWPMSPKAGKLRADPILIVEGQSNTAVGTDLGFIPPSVGRALPEASRT